MSKISFFQNGITNTTQAVEISVPKIVDSIKSDYYKEKIQEIRISHNKKLKNQLDYVTFAGTFSARINDKIIEPSGLICIDIDTATPETKAKLLSHHLTHILFHGPSGEKSLKLIVKIQPITKDNELFSKIYSEIAKTIGIEVDNNARNISRACFMSYDPDIYYNENSSVFNYVDCTKENPVKSNNKIAEIIAPSYTEGKRQMIALGLCGYLRKQGHGIRYVTEVLEGLMSITGDTDYDERMGCVTTTFDKDIKDINGYMVLKNNIETASLQSFVNEITEKEPVSIESMKFLDILDGDFPPISWRIKNIILDDGSITYLAGEAGKFKTYLCLFMIRSLLTGQPFLNQYDIKKSKVMYIDEESGPRRLKERFNKVLGDYRNLIDNEDLIIYSRQNTFSFSDKGMENLEIEIEKHRPDVVFIDSFSRLFMGKENNADDVRMILNYLKVIFNKYNCSFVIIHHFNKHGEKGQRLRGSTELTAQADSVVILEELSIDKYKFYNEKIRDSKKEEATQFEVYDLKENTRMEIEYKGQFSMNDQLSINQKRAASILSYLRNEKLDGKVILLDKIAEHFKVSSRTSLRAVDELVSQGVLVKINPGKYEVKLQ